MDKKEMRVLTQYIERCKDCVYFGWREHDGKRRCEYKGVRNSDNLVVPDWEKIPEWCPLPKVI